MWKFTTVLLVAMVTLSGCSKHGTEPANGTGSRAASSSPPATVSSPPESPAPKQDKAVKLPPVTDCRPVPVEISLPANRPSQAAGTRYAIDQKESCISYTVQEKFVERTLPTNAVGTSSTFVGDLVVDPAGRIRPSTIVMEVRTFKSDSPRRDQLVGLNLSYLDRDPLAELRITGTEGLDSGLQEGKEIGFRLLGTLTLRQIERPVVFETKARLEGDTLTLVAVTEVKQTDFEMIPPNIFDLVKAEDEVHIYVKVIARKR